VTVTSAAHLVDAPRPAVAFIDMAAVSELERGELDPAMLPGPVVALCDGDLGESVEALRRHSWLSHVIGTGMLSHVGLRNAHLTNVASTLESGTTMLDWVRPTLRGRRVRLARASQREEHLARMREYLPSVGVGARVSQILCDAADELLANAFYTAPLAAGVIDERIARTSDVTLPHNSACDLVYGNTDDFALVRVRDPFGALSRDALVTALSQCASAGAVAPSQGLGLWRLLSIASFVAIYVVDRHHTDVMVGVGDIESTPGAARPYALHLFTKPSPRHRTWTEDGET
jgi:hypothetical protein